MAQKILVYRIGSLGDNLVALPAIDVLKGHYSHALLYHLGSYFPGSKRVVGEEIFKNSNLFENYLVYPNPMGLKGFERVFSIFRFLKLWVSLRAHSFDVLVYLVPSSRSRNQIWRDELFFRSAGIKEIVGMRGFKDNSRPWPGKESREVRNEVDALLERLRLSGLKVPDEKMARVRLVLTEKERKDFLELLKNNNWETDKKVWVGVGPGSNQPAKIWPRERFSKTVKKLIEIYDVWPVVIGGAEDAELGDWLVKQWGRGFNWAGKLSVRMSAVALEKCRLYLGNDTGPMHLAVAVGTRCVAIFSSHSSPGKWYPYGLGHKVFRKTIDCEGCGLSVCIEREMECIRSIQVDKVYEACQEIFDHAELRDATR